MRRLVSWAVLLGLLGFAAPATAQPLWPQDPNWARYVESPPSRDIRPVRVVSVSGDVTDPQGLVTRAGNGTTLTYPQGGRPPVIELDYGQEVSGLPWFTVASTGAPTELQAAYSEQLRNLTPTGDGTNDLVLGDTGSPNRYDQLPVAVPGTVKSPLVQGGQRYELITLAQPGSVTLTSVGFDYQAFLGTADTYQGNFLSSSDLLNRIWYAGAYTLNLDQAPAGAPPVVPTDVPEVLDGAKRDRAVWAGDLGQAGPTLYYAFGSAGSPYIRGSLQVLGQHPATVAAFPAPAIGTPDTPGPLAGVCAGASWDPHCEFYSASYSMAFVTGLYAYYLYTGDRAFVAREWPVISREMAWELSQQDANGLFVTNSNDGDDWNISAHVGEATYTNIVFYEALDEAAKMADAVGQPSSAAAWQAQAQRVRTEINARLWDARLGAYDATDTERGFLVQDANVEAVRSGVAPAARARAILSLLASGLASPYGMLSSAKNATADYTPLVSPYMGGFTLDADFATGSDQLGFDLMQTEWGWMISHDPGGVDWERIHPDGTLASSDSAAHAWGTGATSILSHYVLGVSPTAPGYSAYRVQPHLGALTWSEGTVPTPHGPIDVRWSHDASSDSFQLELDAPAGATATVEIPTLGAARTILLNGRAARGRDQGDGYVAFTPLGAGHWTFAWQPRATRVSRRQPVHRAARHPNRKDRR